ncbi:MAG: hypothetical protein AB1442_14015 [Nitrospirota bacterium]
MEDITDQIRGFLMEFKEIVIKRGLYVIPRTENIESLVALRLTKRNRKNEILSLSVAEYCSGPEPDIGGSGHVWMFGKEINGTSVYIKLKIAQVKDKDEKIAKCLSFHVAKFPLCFPYKERREEK